MLAAGLLEQQQPGSGLQLADHPGQDLRLRQHPPIGATGDQRLVEGCLHRGQQLVVIGLAVVGVVGIAPVEDLAAVKRIGHQLFGRCPGHVHGDPVGAPGGLQPLQQGPVPAAAVVGQIAHILEPGAHRAVDVHHQAAARVADQLGPQAGEL